MNVRDYADAAMAELLAQAKKQFGNAIKGFWFYDGDPCPGCGFPIDVTQPWRPNPPAWRDRAQSDLRYLASQDA